MCIRDSIYAEDPYAAGLPSTGLLGSCEWPAGPGRRFEIGFESGDEISSFYDSMIAKVVVCDENRYRALRKMRATLKECVIFGVKTNIPYLLAILDHEDFVAGSMTTDFIAKHFAEGLTKGGLDKATAALADSLYRNLSGVSEEQSSSRESPWQLDWESS